MLLLELSRSKILWCMSAGEPREARFGACVLTSGTTGVNASRVPVPFPCKVASDAPGRILLCGNTAAELGRTQDCRCMGCCMLLAKLFQLLSVRFEASSD